MNTEKIKNFIVGRAYLVNNRVVIGIYNFCVKFILSFNSYNFVMINGQREAVKLSR